MSDETSNSKAGEPAGGKPQDGPVARVIDAFGGIRPMAGKLDVPVSTVQGWKERDSIPATRHAQILLAAQSHHIALDEALLQASAGPGDRPGGVPAMEIGPAPAGDKPAAAAESSAASRASAGPIPTSGGAKPAEAKSTVRKPAAPKPAGPQPTPAKSGGLGLGLLLGALAVIAGFVLAILARDLWQPLIAAGPSADTEVAAALGGRIDDLQQRLTDQSAQLDGLRGRLDSLPASGGDAVAAGALREQVAAVEGALDKLRQDLAVLSQRPALPAAVGDRLSGLADQAAQLGQRVATLEARLGDLDRLDLIVESLIQRAGPGPSNDEVALMLALIQLRETVATGAPYAAALDLVSAAIGDDADLRVHLRPLAENADTGVPTVTRLAQGFPEVARAMVAAGSGGEGLVSDVLRSLSDVVTVRPVGEVAGDDAGAIVARAEISLKSGDLAGALTELDSLPEAARQAAAGWLTDARARRAADAALAALGTAVIGRLAEAKG